MKLQIAATDGAKVFTAYGPGYVSINGVRYENNVAVSAHEVIPAWCGSSFDCLTLADMEFLAGLAGDVTLLGVPAPLRFPRGELLQPFVAAQKGLEVMELGAACRTFNILVGEGRRVVVGLLLA
ncbi:hypothetical protein HCX48_02245 [Rhodocyclus tenuis]|uniref:Uncharacterized protein n=2 Tax=Rhodocyclus TaxID=1064 RepID=A0A6L5JVF5_RHOTE|nr:MTH938/NDUFAF3 family protein [Rhodocyclus gracilis]MQY50540.1 hypothetical protein [Rhodocyclus gracilis]MRD72534.1 hypothetical protein [Rhodocyclus gracilis]NJA88044.1 hypothetical protein [Rhodocyclus gracilis]